MQKNNKSPNGGFIMNPMFLIRVKEKGEEVPLKASLH
jgi:hypothetical protein